MKATIITTGANLRKAAGTGSPIEDQLAEGDVVELLSAWNNPSWLKVRVAKTRTGIAVGKEAYIWSTELRLLPPEPMAPGAPSPMPAPTPDVPRRPFDFEDPDEPEPYTPNERNSAKVMIAISVIVVVAAVIWAIFYGTP